MLETKKYYFPFILLGILTTIAFFSNISLGSVAIPITETVGALFGNHISKESWQYIIVDYRLPKAITACITGGGLAVAGLLMQTLFRNPLAGPFVLGITSGASLGVALLILGAGVFGGIIGGLMLHPLSITLAAALGSLLVMIFVLSFSIKIKDTLAILIIGLMFGMLSSAVVSILAYFSNAQQLQQFIFWSYGSLGTVTWSGILILGSCFLVGIFLSLFIVKDLNALLLGANYAKSMGVGIKKTTTIIIVATCILAGGITAFVGPIAFVGIAVPHIARQFFKTTNHLILIPATLLLGSIMMLFCDSIAQLPFLESTLPINAITSLIGAPIVIGLLVQKRRLFF